MRQKIGQLVQQLDAEIVIVNPDMNMHAAGQKPARHHLHALGQDVIAILVVMFLARPLREGMGRGVDRGAAIPRRDFHQGLAQPDEIGPRLGDRIADSCANLDLGTHEFRRYLAAKPCRAFVQHGLRRIGYKITALQIDEQKLLLYSDGKAGLGERHSAPRGAVKGGIRQDRRQRIDQQEGRAFQIFRRGNKILAQFDEDMGKTGLARMDVHRIAILQTAGIGSVIARH